MNFTTIYEISHDMPRVR